MRDFGSFVLFSIFYILFIILVESLSSADDSTNSEDSTTAPQIIGDGLSTIWNQPQILKDVLKLQWNRIVQVVTAAIGLGFVMLMKMLLLWIGPYLASAPVQAVKTAIAKEASAELLSNVVMKGLSFAQNLYG